MSHLQPAHIAKAKAQHKHAQAPRAMPRSMLVSEATKIAAAPTRDPDRPWAKHWSFHSAPDYRIFTLKK